MTVREFLQSVDDTRDDAFLDGITAIFAENEIVELRHLVSVDKIKYPDGTTGGKRVSF